MARLNIFQELLIFNQFLEVYGTFPTNKYLKLDMLWCDILLISWNLPTRQNCIKNISTKCIIWRFTNTFINNAYLSSKQIHGVKERVDQDAGDEAPGSCPAKFAGPLEFHRATTQKLDTEQNAAGLGEFIS